jgi:hypothetical protein
LFAGSNPKEEEKTMKFLIILAMTTLTTIAHADNQTRVDVDFTKDSLVLVPFTEFTSEVVWKNDPYVTSVFKDFVLVLAEYGAVIGEIGQTVVSVLTAGHYQVQHRQYYLRHGSPANIPIQINGYKAYLNGVCIQMWETRSPLNEEYLTNKNNELYSLRLERKEKAVVEFSADGTIAITFL